MLIYAIVNFNFYIISLMGGFTLDRLITATDRMNKSEGSYEDTG